MSTDELKTERAKDNLVLSDVSGSLTPFGESIKLLRDLADLQILPMVGITCTTAHHIHRVK